jgi:hypothetical protein
VLSALVMLVAPHPMQTRNAPRVGWMIPGAWALNQSNLAGLNEGLGELGHVEGGKINENRVGKISSAATSGGKRCEMAPEEFAKFSPASRLDSDHVGRQRAFGANSRLPRVFAATAPGTS